MSGKYIPREQLTAYERWEVAAFDEAEKLQQTMNQAGAGGPGMAEPEAPAEPPPPPISEEELAALREQAAQEGLQAGHDEGFRNGYAEGYAKGEAAAAVEATRLAGAATAFDAALREFESSLAENLLQLALDIAEQVLRGSLKARPELILPAVREAMSTLVTQHGHPTLRLNPDDAVIVRRHVEDQIAHTGWRLVEDPSIAAGGCKVDNAGAEIDSTLQERWRRVIASLGRDITWIDLP